MESLILFRGIQGVGAGAIFPISLAVIGDLFSPRERGRYQGLFGAVFGVAAIMGPLLGGWLTDSVSWHWIFYVNLPIGAVVLFIIYRFLPSLHGERPNRNARLPRRGRVHGRGHLPAPRADEQADRPTGRASRSAATCSSPPSWALCSSGWSRGPPSPSCPLDLFRDRSYAVTILATFLAAIGFFGAIIFLPRWFQFVQGISPTESGLQTLALLAGLILSSIVSGTS